MKKALITGGAGFIGSHLADRLLNDGYFVYCLDNLYTGQMENIKHLQNHNHFAFINSDVALLTDLEVNEIYNLACPASPMHYQVNPMFTINTCIRGARQTALLAQKLKIKLFHASSSQVYGEPLVHPQPENYWGNVNPIGPRACYDEGKRIAETILFIHHNQQHFPLKIGRIFNTYGPRMDSEDGRVISSFITQALTGQDLTVFGLGNQTRSFCYIDDLIEMILKFMNTCDHVTGPLNLGNCAEMTILEAAKIIIELTNSNSKIIYLPLPINDPSRRKPNLNLNKQTLNYEPKVTFREGIKKTIEYFKQKKLISV